MGKIRSFFKDKFAFLAGHSGKSALSFREKLFISLPGPAAVMGQIVIHNALMKFYTDIIGLNAKYYGLLYLIYSIWNAINDPLLGAYIDKMPFHKKRGKYVYLMRVTAPAMLLSFFFMLLSSPNWSQWMIFGVLLAELFIYDTGYTVYSVSYNSYFLLAVPDKEERVDVEIIRNYLGNFVGMFCTIIPTWLMVGGGKRAYIIPIFSGVVLLNALMFFLALSPLKDREKLYETAVAPEHKNVADIWRDVKEIVFSGPFLTYLLFFVIARGAIAAYYNPFLYMMDTVLKVTGEFATVVDTVAGVVMLLLLPFAGKLIKKYGSKNMTLVCFFPAVLGLGSLVFINHGWQSIISYILIILSLNVIQTSGVVMNGALIDYDEMRTGTRKTGLYGGLFALLTTILTAFQESAFATIISHYGYDGTLETQTERAVWGIRVGAGLVPALLCVVGFIPLIFFPINLELEKKISDFNVKARNGASEDAETPGKDENE
ncbi:MAG: MFS transporter [Lachnospiraceae bacterium]|nr:MFS transporter [Lachnospiraceae bacterium]